MDAGKYSSRFFQNRDCEHFPCHEGIAEEDFNCLFCYCPLYMLGKQCGGQFFYTEKGVKSCKNCIYPHQKENYEQIAGRFHDIKAMIKRLDGEDK